MSDFWWPPELEQFLVAGLRADAAARRVRFEAVQQEVLEDIRYVVLEEIVEPRAALIASPWPDLDPEGRRRFPDRPEDEVDPDQELDAQEVSSALYQEVGVDVWAFQEFLDAHRVPPTPIGANRPARIGDVFAMTRETLDLIGQELQTPDGVVPATAEFDRHTVVDVSRSARAAAKVAFSRVIAPPGENPPDTSTRGPGGAPPAPRPGPSPNVPSFPPSGPAPPTAPTASPAFDAGALAGYAERVTRALTRGEVAGTPVLERQRGVTVRSSVVPRRGWTWREAYNEALAGALAEGTIALPQQGERAMPRTGSPSETVAQLRLSQLRDEQLLAGGPAAWAFALSRHLAAHPDAEPLFITLMSGAPAV